MAVDKEMTILLVEDSKMTRKMELKVLNDLGFHHVIEADDGEQAEHLLAAHPEIALIISDWNMPKRGGIELLRWLRSNSRYAHLPLILATGRAQKKEVTEATEAGASNIITKPFAPVELMRVIEDTFAGKTLQSSHEETQTTRVVEKTQDGRIVLNIAHIQITDHLTLGMAKHLIETGKASPRHFSLKTHCMTSWNPVQQALERGSVDGALVLAPIAMDLFAYGVPVKVVLFAHKNGSICVRKKALTSLPEFFRGKTFCIPHELSVHHLLSHMFLRGMGLSPGIAGSKEGDCFYEVVPPIKMPEFLKMNPDASGFFVAEPIGTKAIAEGIADQLFLSAELWQNHPCCVVALRSEIVDQYGEAVSEFVKLMVEAGGLIVQKPELAAEVGVTFLDPQKTLGLKVPILKNVLTEHAGIKTDDLHPDVQSLETMQRYMADAMDIELSVDFSRFVDASFSGDAYRDITYYTPRHARMLDLNTLVARVSRNALEEKLSAKSLLAQEGKYLIFYIDNQQYGIDVLHVREIVGLLPIREIPQAPALVKGVINLRGKVTPVIDLRLRLNLMEAPHTEKTCIIILEIPLSRGMFHVGIIVDTVSHVETIKAKDVEPTPHFGRSLPLSFIRAMAKTDGKIKILLDAVNLFDRTELEKMASTQD